MGALIKGGAVARPPRAAMMLRPRQKTFVERCTAAIDEKGNTVGIAPTGFGKTLTMSALIGGYLDRGISKTLVLQHRDELLTQNRAKLLRMVPGAKPTIFNAEHKNWNGNVVFASEPTLRRSANIERMPIVDLAVVDECHHVAADGYQRIIARLRESNPRVKLFGVTATIGRGDKKAIEPTFTNVGDQVQIRELIASGHLVRPRTFVIDVGVSDELRQVKKTVADFDMEAVAALLDRAVVNEAVVKHWREKAGDRQTVVFCSTVAHAQHVMETFREAGIASDIIHGELSIEDRRRRLAAYGRRETQVIVSVATLTEGWDSPPTACVILLRPSSYKSTYLQMVGRGLRTIDPTEHPGVVKLDCVLLDFGRSTLVHGSLEQDANLAPQKGQAPVKVCPECDMVNPLSAKFCEGCGYEWEAKEAEFEPEPQPLSDFIMSEVDLLARSNFRWVDLFDDDAALMATGFGAWGGLFFWAGAWHANRRPQ